MKNFNTHNKSFTLQGQAFRWSKGEFKINILNIIILCNTQLAFDI